MIPLLPFDSAVQGEYSSKCTVRRFVFVFFSFLPSIDALEIQSFVGIVVLVRVEQDQYKYLYNPNHILHGHTPTQQRIDEYTNTQLSISVEQCFCLHFVMMLKMESMLTNEFNIDEIQRARIDGYFEWNRKEFIIIGMLSDRFSAQLNESTC